MRPIFCEDAAPVFFNLFDLSIAPALLWYSYIPILILLLVFSLIALHFNKADRNSKLLTAISLTLGFWIVVTFLQWIAAPITLVMFSWQLWGLAGSLMYLCTALFIHSFIYDAPVSHVSKITLSVFLLPIIIFLPTNLNVSSFDLSWCEGVNGAVLLTYTYLYHLGIIIYIAFIGVRAYYNKKHPTLTPKLTLITSVSAVVFLTLFLAVNIWGDLVDDYRVELLGPVGAVVFLAAMSYVSISYKKFDIKLIGSEILIVGLGTIVGSMMFINEISAVRYIAAGSLVLVAILGFILSRSIRREIQHRREIEQLAVKLKKANKRLKVLDQMKSEFVSIASHQLRSPLTSIRGYASMLLEGSYGKLPTKATDAVTRISDSSTFMASSIEDYLNVSRIEAGNMKYELADFNLKDEAEHVADDKRQEAMKKGLLITFKSDLDLHGIVNADIGKTRQVLHNLVNNSIKYTPRGTITIFVHDDKKNKKIYVDIIDSGIGMKADELDDIFGKFERAHNANETNVTGTGLGLFVARKMARHMKGDVTAHSDGVGHGSTFRLEMPLQM